MRGGELPGVGNTRLTLVGNEGGQTPKVNLKPAHTCANTFALFRATNNMNNSKQAGFKTQQKHRPFWGWGTPDFLWEKGFKHQRST